MKSADSLKRDVESNVMLKRVKIPERRVAIKWFHSWLLPRDFSQYACPRSSSPQPVYSFQCTMGGNDLFLILIRNEITEM